MPSKCCNKPIVTPDYNPGVPVCSGCGRKYPEGTETSDPTTPGNTFMGLTEDEEIQAIKKATTLAIEDQKIVSAKANPTPKDSKAVEDILNDYFGGEWNGNLRDEIVALITKRERLAISRLTKTATKTASEMYYDVGHAEMGTPVKTIEINRLIELKAQQSGSKEANEQS